LIFQLSNVFAKHAATNRIAQFMGSNPIAIIAIKQWIMDNGQWVMDNG
jgi:hypothetical protein